MHQKSEKTMKTLDLENKWFYRLVKVMYIFFLTIGFIGVLFMGWSLKPYQYISDEDSYLVCLHGLHSFKDAELYLPSDSIKFSSYYDKKARGLCINDAIKYINNKANNKKEKSINLLKDEMRPALARAELKRRKLLRPTDPIGHYEINLEYNKTGSWISAIKLWFLGSLIVFFIFNLIKQSLLYIVYGKKFTLNW